MNSKQPDSGFLKCLSSLTVWKITSTKIGIYYTHNDSKI